jgi:hypothetical protein
VRRAALRRCAGKPPITRPPARPDAHGEACRPGGIRCRDPEGAPAGAVDVPARRDPTARVAARATRGPAVASRIHPAAFGVSDGRGRKGFPGPAGCAGPGRCAGGSGAITPGRPAPGRNAGTPRPGDVVAARASARGAEDRPGVRAVASAKDGGPGRRRMPLRRFAGVTRRSQSAERERITRAKQARGRPQIARGCGGRGPARDSHRADGWGTASRRFLPFVFHSNTGGPADVRAPQRWLQPRLLKSSKWKRMIVSHLYLQLDENPSCMPVALR